MTIAMAMASTLHHYYQVSQCHLRHQCSDSCREFIQSRSNLFIGYIFVGAMVVDGWRSCIRLLSLSIVAIANK